LDVTLDIYDSVAIVANCKNKTNSDPIDVITKALVESIATKAVAITGLRNWDIYHECYANGFSAIETPFVCDM
jgi:hypothetical protein